MNRSDLVKRVSRRTLIPSETVERVLDQIVEEITTSLSLNENVTVANFGRFEVRLRGPAIRRDPRVGTEIKVPARKAVLFHPSRTFKGAVQ